MKGRIVDTAGDGAFTCFPTVDYAAPLSSMQKRIMRQNLLAQPGYGSLFARTALWECAHHGVVVSGDTCEEDLADHLARSKRRDQLTHDAFTELSLTDRLRCGDLKMGGTQGLRKPVGVLSLSLA